jgi:hypothetical protein
MTRLPEPVRLWRELSILLWSAGGVAPPPPRRREPRLDRGEASQATAVCSCAVLCFGSRDYLERPRLLSLGLAARYIEDVKAVIGKR